MIISNFIKNTYAGRRGFTLFIAVVTASLVLAIGLSILSITLKEFLLSGTLRDSEMAFYAADAGMECAQYFDASTAGGEFDIDGNPADDVTCMGQSPTVAAADKDWNIAQKFQFQWGTDPVLCTKVEVVKKDVSGGCPVGVTCTQITSRGYNRACNELASPRTVERALRTTIEI